MKNISTFGLALAGLLALIPACAAADQNTQAASDWKSLNAWFDAQTGPYRDGADYWSAHRNVRRSKTCQEEAEDHYGDEADPRVGAFYDGCEAAKYRLDRIDARRANPEYRAAFKEASNGGSPSPQHADVERAEAKQVHTWVIYSYGAHRCEKPIAGIRSPLVFEQFARSYRIFRKLTVERDDEGNILAVAIDIKWPQLDHETHMVYFPSMGTCEALKGAIDDASPAELN